MTPLRRLSIDEQTTAHLREALRRGRWGDSLPGVLKLAGDLDVSKDAIRAALRRLEADGVITSGGHGRSRKVAASKEPPPRPATLRIAIFLSEPMQNENGSMQRLLLQLQHALEAAGHACVFAPQSQSCLRHDLRRIARMVASAAADAWVVVGGTAELIEWFSRQTVPAIALGGRRSDAPLARVAMDLTSGMRECVRQLAALGHRRIVFACPPEWRQPTPGLLAQAFLDAIPGRDSAATDYHLPNWERSAAGFDTLLRSLFQITPPTALIVIEPAQAVAVLAFLAGRRLRVPQDLSLVTRLKDSSLEWCRPALAHFKEAPEFIIRHIVRWIGGVARGKISRGRIVRAVDFDPAESIAPPREFAPPPGSTSGGAAQ